MVFGQCLTLTVELLLLPIMLLLFFRLLALCMIYGFKDFEVHVVNVRKM